MKKASIGCTVISLMLVSSACTSVRHRFVAEGYPKNPEQMIKVADSLIAQEVRQRTGTSRQAPNSGK